MATATIPIQKIRVDSTLSTSLSRSSALPPPVRSLLRAWLFPRVLSFICEKLSGHLGQLNQEQANQLYGPLFQLHLEVNALLDIWSKGPWIMRQATGWWARRVRSGADRLGDIVEALAWGADPDLRTFIEASITELETQSR
jgi:hypothetical protein